MRILLVDDEPFALKLLSRQLYDCGFSDVLACEHAIDALAALEADMEQFGMVFCDLQMPTMDGVEFIRQLAHMNYVGGLVLISGENDRILQTAEKLSKAHRLNVLGALNKPVSPERLRQVLEVHPSLDKQVARVPRKVYGPDDIRRAIAEEQLVNYYQPKVDLVSGAFTCVETLVRWLHPKDGVVFPDEFIFLAEEHELIDQMTRVVLVNALRQVRVWQDDGLELRVAVNVSMDSLGLLEFPDFVASALAEAGVSPDCLVLEVTESRLMKDPLASLDILTRLRLKHIGLSIDDFGTGHSSLAQLRDIPFDELKIDRSFVHGAHSDPSLRAIFAASLGMARQLGMKTVAEGVEDRADWNFLRAIGCDQAQGYFIARPMLATTLAKWMEEWEIRRHELMTYDS